MPYGEPRCRKTHNFCINARATGIPSWRACSSRMEFSVQARLVYRVRQETPFVFNVQAQSFMGQAITSESLRIEPQLSTEDWTMPESANRYFRLIAPPGEFKVTYEAPSLR
jgi:hypothetical protein